MSSRLPVAGVAMLLLLSVAAANVVITAERTALNDEYATETLESEGVYESATVEIQSTIQSEIESFAPAESERIPQGVEFAQIDAAALAEQSISEAYIRNQTNRNIERLFAYLHGDRSELGFRVGTERLQANVANAVSEQVSSVDPGAVLDDSAAEIGDSGFEVNGSLAQEMYENQTAFRQAKFSFQLQYGDRSDEIARDAKDRAHERAREMTSQYNQSQITQGTIRIQDAVIDGLTDPEMTHEEYRREFEAGRSQIADGVGQAAAAEIDERLGGELSSSEIVDAELESSLAESRGFVQTMDTLQVALPIVSLLLIALLYGITRAWQPTAKVTGQVLILVGAVALVAVVIQSALLGVVEDRVRSQVQNNEVLGMDVVTSFVEGIFETLAIQSGLLVLVGIALVAVAVADTRGYLDGIRRTLGVSPSGTSTTPGEASDRGYQQPPQGQHPPQEQQPPRTEQDQHPQQPTGRSIARSGPQQSSPSRAAQDSSQEHTPTESTRSHDEQTDDATDTASPESSQPDSDPPESESATSHSAEEFGSNSGSTDAWDSSGEPDSAEASAEPNSAETSAEPDSAAASESSTESDTSDEPE